MFLTHLLCSACGTAHDAKQLRNLCTKCQKPLLVEYDLTALARSLTRETLLTRQEKSLWRFRELLPLPRNVEPISLGEGGTPLLRAPRFGAQVGLSNLWIKDESVNPTQSFKARGMSVAVSMAQYLGATKLAVPSAGMLAARSPPMPRVRGWKRTFLCRAILRAQTLSNAASSARTSP
jgi:threonine synthase